MSRRGVILARRSPRSTPACQNAPVDALYPLLLVADVEASSRFYREQLGFEFVFPHLAEAHLAGDFAMLRRGGATVQLKALPDGQPNPNHAAHPDARQDGFIATQDPDSLCQELRERGVHIVEDVTDTDWGTREFRFADDSGYVFACGCSVDA